MHTHWKDMLIHSCYGRRFKEAKKIKKYKKIRIQIWTDKRMARDSRLFDYKLHFPFLQIVFLNWLKRIVRHNCLSSDYEILQPICQYNKLDNISRFTTCKKLSLEKHLQISKWFQFDSCQLSFIVNFQYNEARGDYDIEMAVKYWNIP